MCSHANMLVIASAQTKRKKRRSNSGISRHQDKRGASSKHVKQNPAPQSQMLFAELSPIVHAPQPDEGQQLKSIRNKLDYKRRKGAMMVEQLAAAKDKLLVANDRISDLQQANKSLSNKTAALKMMLTSLNHFFRAEPRGSLSFASAKRTRSNVLRHELRRRFCGWRSSTGWQSPRLSRRCIDWSAATQRR